jgi:heme-degrading monooxygenase HmoA
MKRPPPVWTTQILLSFFFLLSLPGLFVWTTRVFLSLWGSAKPPVDSLLFLGEYFIRLALVGFLAFSVIAIWKRWSRARIIGLTALLLVFVVVLYSKLNPMPPGQGLPEFELRTPAQQGGALIADALMFVGFWALWIRFGFSDKSRRFFEQPNNAMQGDVRNARACWRALGVTRKTHMILEVAILNIRPGKTLAFESAFAEAQSIIASMPGYIAHELQHCVEDKNKYILLVKWETLESHTIGFRQSAEYLEWKKLLHHFYDPFPTVEHFQPLGQETHRV